MKLKEFIGGKIKEYRLLRGMSQEALSDKLGTTKQTISRYENGGRQANQDVLFELSNIFNVSINDFFPQNEIAEKEAPYIVEAGSSDYTYYPTAISAGLPLNVEAITQADKIKLHDTLMGKWARHDDIFITKICGDSMNKVMQDGSLIAVKPINLSELKDYDIVVFSLNGEYGVKQYRKQDNHIIFSALSTNKDYFDQVYKMDDNIKIHGKVVMYIVELD